MPVRVDFSRLPELINPVYMNYFYDFRFFQILKGGGSAGKSVYITQRGLHHLTVAPGYNMLVIRKVGATNHDSTFAEFKARIKEWGMEDLFIIKESSGHEEIISRVSKNKILFKGLDDAEKLKSLTFDTGPLAVIWVEEATEITEDDLNQLIIRLRGISQVKKHIILSFNPIDSDHWIKSRFFDRRLDEKDGFICETTYKDNNFLTDMDRANLEALKDIDFYYYQVYALNQWGNREGTKVFYNIEIHDFDILEHNFENKRAGLDFGFNHAQALMRTGFVDGELYIYRELYAKRLLNNKFIEEAEKIHEKDFYITADSANPDKISEWNEAGFMVDGAKKTKGSLAMGIDWLRSLKKIHIHKTNCPNASREFPLFKFRQTRDGQVLDGQYVELNDDTIAAVRYANEDFFIDGIGLKEPQFLGALY